MNIIYKNVSIIDLKKHLKNLRNLENGKYLIKIRDMNNKETLIKVSISYGWIMYIIGYDKLLNSMYKKSGSEYFNTSFVKRWFKTNNMTMIIENM